MAIKNVYLDNAATTPLHPRVLEKMIPFLKEEYGNASSIHSYGRKVRIAVEEAREVIARFINCDPSEIYFTSSGTEANNFAVFGIAKTEFGESGRRRISTTTTEHHCVLDAFVELERQGFEADYLRCGSDSTMLPGEIDKISEDTSFLSVIHVNNETGGINDIKSISERLTGKNTYFHSDMVQSFGKMPVDVADLKVDSVSVSAHKINGPKGAGATYVKNGTPMAPMIFGGSQERNRRGGTENPAAIIGFAEAVKIAAEEMENNLDIVTRLKKDFTEGIAQIDNRGIFFNSAENTSPYVASITFGSDYYNNDPEAMLMYLDINGIAASNGAACTSGTLKPSHVIMNSGRSAEDAAGTIRFSFGAQNTQDEISYVLDVLKRMSGKFRK